ncbi:tRNA pseudouridine(38-40) synthase TruA [Biformimicrobium ophioploci]|uniref:tRNA pseudouridine synthase A n=1 Tax=Biformimicrobium ophioploci TaxID=3036711 RepID=A0ABQ6LZD8_9GAMM|nr:tRNA pseudouridine(38-40) synthase TruA [Microbulbifer sp. NKW57]GMG87463.1 tRNA pseudouridine(38-40) synthase TruA [Microbulbifer sp. NKW57]
MILNESDYSYTPNCEVPDGCSLPEGVRRVALGVEYDGSDLHGFQSQKSGVPTVQGALEVAISSVAAEPVTLVCAGRTDAGVHGTGQVVHFDTSAVRPSKAWVQGVNTKLPFGIRVRWSREVNPQFHARFSARARTYRYLIESAPVRSAISHRQVTWVEQALDVAAMREACQYLLGEHDFSSFRASQCQARSPVRCVDYLQVSERGRVLVVEVTANAFLHHMVRNIVGVLLRIGRGSKPPEWAREVLEARDRSAGCVTAPPFGLYMVHVEYPESFGLPRGDIGPLLASGPLRTFA